MICMYLYVKKSSPNLNIVLILPLWLNIQSLACQVLSEKWCKTKQNTRVEQEWKPRVEYVQQKCLSKAKQWNICHHAQMTNVIYLTKANNKSLIILAFVSRVALSNGSDAAFPFIILQLESLTSRARKWPALKTWAFFNLHIHIQPAIH